MSAAVGERRVAADATTSEVLAGLDLSRLEVIVTGASGGLGAETARALADRGASVTLAVRDLEKGRKAADAIRAATESERVAVMELALDVQASVRAFAAAYRGSHERLGVLINNAGVMGCPLGRTAEGYELQFATNHLGHFLLTGLLAPLLRAAAPARVVSLSSGGHRFSPVVFDDIHFERQRYDKWLAYGQSKTANVLFAVELDRRLQGAGVRANAVHPGAIVTELGRHLDADDIARLTASTPGGRGLQFKPVPVGAATSVWAATAPELEGRGGLYLEDCHIAREGRADDSMEGYEPYARDPEAARRLWAVSEEMVGERFDLGS